MKRIIFTLLGIISIFAIGQAQCTFEKIFPIEFGISKFNATTTIAFNKSIKQDNEANQYLGILNSWEKPDYLKGDSVFKTSYSYDYIFQDCFKGDENELYLRFVDDKLYKMRITLNFSNAKIERCLENYNSLIAVFKNKFPEWAEFVQTNHDTKEQIGVGYTFYPTSENKQDNVKINNLSIEYKVKYEMKYSEYKKEMYSTGNVEKYVVEIEYVNLKGTKLTNEGY